MGAATVVVIGAGASGIVAARSLLERGCGKVIVLEARDRVGARASPRCAMPPRPGAADARD
jgi:cation diffusion facilitator CzcD-associated flavoprotein CzcO